MLTLLDELKGLCRQHACLPQARPRVPSTPHSSHKSQTLPREADASPGATSQAGDMAEWRTVLQEISAFIQADELLPHLQGCNLRVVPTPAPRRALECSSPLTLGEAVLVSCNFGQARTPHSHLTLPLVSHPHRGGMPPPTKLSLATTPSPTPLSR